MVSKTQLKPPGIPTKEVTKKGDQLGQRMKLKL